MFLLISFQTLKRGRFLNSVIIASTFSIGVYYVYAVLLQGALTGFPSWLGGSL